LIHGCGGVDPELTATALKVADVGVLRLLEAYPGSCSLRVEGLAPHRAVRSAGQELVLGVEAAVTASAGRLSGRSPFLSRYRRSVVGYAEAIHYWARAA